MMKNAVLALLTFAGCVTNPWSSDTTNPSTASAGGCPPGQQPVFGDGPELTCAPVPEWPPPRTGSRSTQAACALRDGTYADIRWETDHDTDVFPAFTVSRILVIAGNVLILSRPGFDDWGFNVDWADAGTAFAWEAGDTDTWEFVVWRDCARETIRGTRTVNLPYRNPGHQVETWTFEVPDPPVR